MEEMAKIVGANLAELRKRKKLTQQELAEQIGYSDKSLSKWELGNALPHVDVLKKIGDFYGVSVDFLITENAAKEKRREMKDERSNMNKIVITCMAATFIILCAIVIYLYNILITEDTDAWVYFLWAAPICFFLTGFMDHHFWGRNLAFWILMSLFIWTMILAVCMHFYVYQGEQVWFIFLVGVPLEVGLLLFSRLK